MKKILIPALLVCSLFAQEQENYIQLGVGYDKTKDSFSTSNSNTIKTFDEAKSDNATSASIELYYNYQLNHTASIYTQLGNGQAKLGTNLDTEFGVFDLGLKGEFSGEEWKNPFLLNKKRETTKTNEFGGYIAYELPISEDLQSTLKYEFSKKKYKDDKVKEVLKRDGSRHIVNLENSFYTEHLGFFNTLGYERYNAKGDASSYDKYSVDLGVMTPITDDIIISLTTSYAKQKYKKLNPEVNKRVKTDIYGIGAQLTWDTPFNLDRVYTNLSLGYEKEKSNSNFYNKQGTYGLLSVGYRF